jgi:hypothetical protein
MAWMVVAADKPAEPAKPAPSTNAALTTPATKPAPALPVIGYLETRGKTIIIKSGPKGPVYSVKNSRGKIIFENLSTEQLRAKAPEIHEFLKTAFAQGSSSTRGAQVDAGLRLDGIR